MAFYTGFLYKIVEDSLIIKTTQAIDEKTVYVFIAFGTFEFIGGLTNVYLADKYHIYFT